MVLVRSPSSSLFLDINRVLLSRRELTGASSWCLSLVSLQSDSWVSASSTLNQAFQSSSHLPTSQTSSPSSERTESAGGISSSWLMVASEELSATVSSLRSILSFSRRRSFMWQRPSSLWCSPQSFKEVPFAPLSVSSVCRESLRMMTRRRHRFITRSTSPRSMSLTSWRTSPLRTRRTL